MLSSNSTQNEVDPSDPSLSEDDDEVDNSDDEDEPAAASEQNLGPETGGASGESIPLPFNEETFSLPVIDTRISEQERNIQQLMRIAPNARPPEGDIIAWPETGEFVNDFNTPGIYSMAFPCLFPYGLGDPSNRDRQIAISENECGKHLLKYAINVKKMKEVLLEDPTLTPSERRNVESLHSGDDPDFIYPFVNHKRFVHFLQNTVERHRAFSQRGFWLQKHSEFGTMDASDMSVVINQGGEQLRKLLSSMQAYNANINGSPQYLYRKRKLLEQLIEQHGLCTMWFTLSMADNHWKDMFIALNRDGNGNEKEFPTFLTPQAEASWKRKFVRENPHFVDSYFNNRVRHLFDTIFSEKGLEIDWLWFRIEYQARGAPHVHGCLKLKHDPDLPKLGNKVFKGRLAAKVLAHIGAATPEDHFDAADVRFDEFKSVEDLIKLDMMKLTYTPTEIQSMKKEVQEGKRSQEIIIAYQDYLITTWNHNSPRDAWSNERDESTFFDPVTTTVPHPSAINPLDVFDNEREASELYCRSCNVQSRHKHQAYCDKNHKKREIQKAKFLNQEPNAIDPATIPCNCRFSYPFDLNNKSCVAVEQTIKKGELITRLKIRSKRNDKWMNSHMRCIMEVSALLTIYSFSYTFETHPTYFIRCGEQTWTFS